jgi:hypothetical protein
MHLGAYAGDSFAGTLWKKGGGFSFGGRRNWKVRAAVRCVCVAAVTACSVHCAFAFAPSTGRESPWRVRSHVAFGVACQNRYMELKDGKLAYYKSKSVGHRSWPL